MSILDDVDHRPPILCLDTVLHQDHDSARCEHTVVDGPHGHDGAMWEAGMIEGMAQTTALLKARSARAAGLPVRSGMLVGLREFSIHWQPRIGETIQFEVEIVRSIEPMTLVHCRTWCDRELLAEGELKFYLEPESPEAVPPDALSPEAGSTDATSTAGPAE